ncbi:arsinothricin resistance N-acetyltransferase ArsN1 family A [Priestia megaterium]
MNVRIMKEEDLPQILSIYNEGIEDRIATLEEDLKDLSYIKEWLYHRNDRYEVIVAEIEKEIIGWASLNPYSHRCAYDGVADISIYINRENRGKGIGKALLHTLEVMARKNKFHKLVLSTFPFNEAGQKLYRSLDFREVGIFYEQGILDNEFVDVMVMEKILR